MHKLDLDEDVANTNAAYRKHLGQTVKQETREAEKAKDDRGLIADIRRKLGFGDQ